MRRRFAELRIGDKTIRLPIVVGHRGRARDRHPKLRDETGLHHPRSGLRQHRLVPQRDHLHRRREGHPALPRLPDRGARREEQLPRGRLPADLRRAADEAAARRLHARRSATTRCCTRTSSASTARCRRTRTRWRPASAAVGALATFYPDSLDPRDPRQVEISVHRLIAKMPTMAAYAFKHSIGQPFMYPDNRLAYVGNFLHLMFATPCEEYARRPGGREGDRPAADPARRPRAELLDQHGAAGAARRW